MNECPEPHHTNTQPDRLEVVPLNDLRDHDAGTGCWCRPDVQDGIIVHHAMDGREEYERGRKLH